MSAALIFGQLRANFGRFLATILAIAISVAFIVASGGLVTSLQKSVLDIFGQKYVDASVVVDGVGDRTSATTDEDRAQLADQETQALEAIRNTEGVAAATVDRETNLRVIPDSGDTQRFTTITSLAGDDELRWQELKEGEFPEAPGELLAPAGEGMEVGDSATLRLAGNHDPQHGTVVGTYDYIAQPDNISDFPLFTTDAQLREWSPNAGGEIRIAGTAEDSPQAQQALRTEVAQSLSNIVGSDNFEIRTADYKTRDAAELILGGLKAFNLAVYAFSVIAIAVAALVISTTFAVLMAGRIRQIALLRTVGASKAQTRAMALGEALIIAALGTAAGLALGTWATGAITANADAFGVQFPITDEPIPARSFALALFVGIVVTLAAAAVPIARATSHSPLAALRPVDVKPVHPVSLALICVLGAAVAVAGWLGMSHFADQSSPVYAAGFGVVSFIGILALMCALVPLALGALGRLLAFLPGVTVMLAFRNAARSPRRTGSIVAALLVGVTLVSCMTAGIALLKPTLEAKFINRIPLDVAVSAPDGILPAEIPDQLATAPGVDQLVRITAMPIEVEDDSVSSGSRSQVARTADPAELGAIMSRPVTLPEPGEIVVPESSPLSSYFADAAKAGESIPVTFFEDDVRELTPVMSNDPWVLVNPADAPPWPEPRGSNGEPWPEGMEIPAEFIPREEAWLQMDPNATDEQREDDLAGIRTIVADIREDTTVSESFAGREQLRESVGTAVTASYLLVAISVLIALLAIINTFVLAVRERRLASALLRDVGATRLGITTSIVIEALAIALISSVIGVIAGSKFAEVGVRAFLGSTGAAAASTPAVSPTMIVAVSVIGSGICALLSTISLAGSRASR